MKKSCENCWFYLHYPWLCEKTVVKADGKRTKVLPQDKGSTCMDWRDRKS